MPPILAAASFAAALLADAGPGKRADPRPVSAAPVAACCRPDMTPEQLERARREFGLRAPGELLGPGEDFAIEQTAWWRNSLLVAAGLGVRADLSFSFAADGVLWGAAGFGAGPSDLLAAVASSFGPANVDLGLEYIRQAFAGYRSIAGLSFFEAPDDGAPWGTAGGFPLRGDIRLGGVFAGDIIVGYATFPSDGADISINTNLFFTGNLGSNWNDYRYLRNTASHEVGHTLGLAHAVPCDNTKILEPVLVIAPDGLGIDDVRGVQRNYGDRFAGVGDDPVFTDLGDMTDRSVIFTDLSTNGPENQTLFSDRDLFRFRLASTQRVRVTVALKGGQYRSGRQVVDCEPSMPPIVNAGAAGAPRLAILDANAITILRSTVDPPGTDQRIDTFLGPGEFVIRVIDFGPNPPANQSVQLYDFSVLCGESPSPAPPTAIAGVNKRVPVDKRCFFIGDLHSRAVQPGAFLSNASFDWDLNGDGAFETLNTPRPSRVFYSNGRYDVALRLTDSNGQIATDAITVTVHGGHTNPLAVFPPSVPRGATTPVVIAGTNLRNVVTSTNVTVSGFGVIVEGVPEPDDDGLTVSGLSFRVLPGAATGPRTLFVVTVDGQGIGPNLVTITEAIACPGDANGDGAVNFVDLNIVLTEYGMSGPPGSLPGDLSGDGAVDFNDLNIVLTRFGSAC